MFGITFEKIAEKSPAIFAAPLVSATAEACFKAAEMTRVSLKLRF